MGRDAIISFADERGIERQKPPLRDVLTEDQIDQIKYARSQGLSWTTIARYFREVHELDYGRQTYGDLFGDLD